MCGRFTLITPINQLIELFGLDETDEELAPRYNIAPTQMIPTILAHEGGQPRRLTQMRWGLVPSWAESPQKLSLINARGETLDAKPAFRALVARRRCLIPADGFYEWLKRGRERLPYYIRRRDGRPFALAGLWDRWRREGIEPIDSCTVITTDANELVAPLHDRMPAILDPADFGRWLDLSAPPGELLNEMCRPYSAELMEAIPVSPLINRATLDDPRCIEPAEHQAPAPEAGGPAEQGGPWFE